MKNLKDFLFKNFVVIMAFLAVLLFLFSLLVIFIEFVSGGLYHWSAGVKFEGLQTLTEYFGLLIILYTAWYVFEYFKSRGE